MISSKNSDLLSILYHVSLDFIDDTIYSSWSHHNYWTDENFPVKTWMLSVSYVIWPWTVVALGSQLISISTWGLRILDISAQERSLLVLEPHLWNKDIEMLMTLLLGLCWYYCRCVKEPLFRLPKMNTLAPSLVFSDVFPWHCLRVSLKPSSGISSGIPSALETQAETECAFCVCS